MASALAKSSRTASVQVGMPEIFEAKNKSRLQVRQHFAEQFLKMQIRCQIWAAATVNGDWGLNKNLSPTTNQWEKNKFGHFVVVVQLIHRLTQAEISCTTMARMFFIPLLAHNTGGSARSSTSASGSTSLLRNGTSPPQSLRHC